MRKNTRAPFVRTRTILAAVMLLGLVSLGCGGGGSSHRHRRVVEGDRNPGRDLVGFWTGTFSDDVGDYTVSLEFDAPRRVPTLAPGNAFIPWGEESLGLLIDGGELEQIGTDRWSFVYDTVQPGSLAYVDTVTGEFIFVDDNLLEGTFATTSGSSGVFSLAWSGGFQQEDMQGPWAMEFADPDTRAVFWVGEVELDRFGDVVVGPGSYLTDDLSGPVDPGAGYWPLVGGWVDLVDPVTGYYEGELWFADEADTILLSGYLGFDLFVYAGLFEDLDGPGIFTFLPQ